MPNSSLLGHLDRRKKMPENNIRVKDAVDRIYKSAGFEPSQSIKSPNSGYLIEQECYRHAVRDLDCDDRKTVEECVKTLSDKMVGCNFGEGSAMQVLAKIGILLSLAEQERK